MLHGKSILVYVMHGTPRAGSTIAARRAAPRRAGSVSRVLTDAWKEWENFRRAVAHRPLNTEYLPSTRNAHAKPSPPSTPRSSRTHRAGAAGRVARIATMCGRKKRTSCPRGRRRARSRALDKYRDFLFFFFAAPGRNFARLHAISRRGQSRNCARNYVAAVTLSRDFTSIRALCVLPSGIGIFQSRLKKLIVYFT